MRWIIEIVVRPPSFFPDTRLDGQDVVHRSLQSRDFLACIDALEELANRWLMGLDEAEESIRILLVVPTPNPEAELLVGYRKNPTPVFGPRLFGLESLNLKPLRRNSAKRLPQTPGLICSSSPSYGGKFSERNSTCVSMPGVQ